METLKTKYLFKEKNQSIQEFINPSTLSIIKSEVAIKWFSLYNWISFSELRKTVIIDYLAILTTINIPFGVLFVITGATNYLMFRSGIISFGFLYVLAWGYFITFAIMFWKMIYRSWIFLKISNIIFTDTHIGVGDKLISLDNYGGIKADIDKYGSLFYEKLWEESQIVKKIKELKESLFSSKNPLSSSNSSFLDFDFKDRESSRFAFVILLLVVAYWISLYVFYVLGWVVAFTLSYVFVGVMKVLYLLQNKEEIKINWLFESLSVISDNLKKSTETLTQYIEKNKEWNWTEKNKTFISYIEKNLILVHKGLSESKNLYEILKQSKYKEVFNFTTFHNWVNIQITDPTRKFLELLIILRENIDKQISFLTHQMVNANDLAKGQYKLQQERLHTLKNSLDVQIITWTNLLEKIQSQVFTKLHS